MATVNVLYGPNGSGKTTISRALQAPDATGATIGWCAGAQPLDVVVYNRDYVRSTISNAGALPGVFRLGTGSAEAEAEIDELERPGGTIALATAFLASQRSTLGQTANPRSGKLGELQDARNALMEAAWTASKAFPQPLRDQVFDGYRGVKAKLLAQTLAVAARYATTDTQIEDLVNEASSVFDAAATTLESIPMLSATDPGGFTGAELLTTPVIGSSNGTLTQLINTLNNSDWVSHGRTQLENSDGRCPFCQQPTPADLAEQLALHFDERFEEQSAAVTLFAENYSQVADVLRKALESIAARESTHLAAERFSAARTTLEATLAANEATLGHKQEHLAQEVQILPIGEFIDDVNLVVSEANASIGKHNERVSNRAAERVRLIEDCWRHFVRETLRDEVNTFETTSEALLKAKAGLEAKIAEAESRLAAHQSRLSELRNKVRSSKEVITSINDTLRSVGFTSFHLAESTERADGYCLVRDGGVPAASSLSEGECTFLTFLYFYYQLQNVPADAGSARDLVVVIDDPISSLDSDILFVVSTLTRQIIQSAIKGTDHVKQVVLLTHNTQFHHEVTYVRHGESDASRVFFTIRKMPGSPSRIDRSTDNPVTTAYRAMWNEVKRADADPSVPVIGLENILRRIIENYFKTIGGVNDDDLLAHFSVAEQAACRSLFSWMNGGSHTIVDDLHFSPSGLSTATNLDVFRRVFELTHHGGHYRMMMGITEVATPLAAPIVQPIDEDGPSTEDIVLAG
ncbi:MAG: AAA family ATPase [Cellulomonadaceae bacterium]|nr:AAA family ATPase [Cellulomonadaceae bacterium]